MDSTRHLFDQAALDALGPVERRQAIAALAEMSKGHERNPLWRFDPLDPRGCGIPHIPQHRWLSNHHTPEGKPVKFRLLPGGNRGGKTTTGDVADIIDLVDREAVPPHLQRYKRWDGPISMYLVAPSDRAVRNIHLPIFRQWCPKDQLVGGSIDKAFNKEYGILSFKNGSSLMFMTQRMDVDVFQGTPLHIVHFDEEPLYDHGHSIFTECMQRLVDFNGEVRATFTPLHGMTWMYDVLWEPWEQAQPDKEAAVEGFAAIEFGGFSFPMYGHRVDQDDNPVIDEEGKAAALALAKNDEERQSRKSGRFVSFSGRIYEDFSRTRHVVPDAECLERFRRPTLQALVGGLDPGFRHQAAALWVGLDDDGLWVFPELVAARTVIGDVAAEIEKTRLTFGLRPVIFGADPAIAKIDAQTGMTDAQAYAAAGVLTRPSNNSVRPGINAIRALLATNRLHVGAGCDELILQLQRYRWKSTGRTEDHAPDRPVKRDDHVADALRYAVMILPIPEVEQTPDTRSNLRRALDADLKRAMEGEQVPVVSTIGPGQFE